MMKAVKANSKDVEFVGIGGPLMEEQGLKSLMPMDQLCVMGLFEVLGQLPRLLKLIGQVTEEVEKANPDTVLTIDLPDFNFEVVKRLRKRGQIQSKFIHYVAPTVWAWRSGRAKMIAGLYDQLFCLLPFEPQHFTIHGLDTKFIGHPLVERDLNYDASALRKAHGINDKDVVLGLFFGSRGGEFKAVGPTLCETAALVQKKNPNVKFLVPTLPQHEERIKSLLSQHNLEAVIVSDQSLKWDAFAACNVALAVSGTVALELAYLGVPHVVTYKAHPATAFIARHLIKIEHIHLANIIMDSPIVPEYVQEDSNPEDLSQAVLELIEDDVERNAQINQLKEIPKILGANEDFKPSERVAKEIAA